MEGAAQGDEGILREYVPPIPEFRVQVMSLQKKDAGYAPPAVPSASTLLVYKGAATITAEWKGKSACLTVLPVGALPYCSLLVPLPATLAASRLVVAAVFGPLIGSFGAGSEPRRRVVSAIWLPHHHCPRG